MDFVITRVLRMVLSDLLYFFQIKYYNTTQGNHRQKDDNIAYHQAVKYGKWSHRPQNNALPALEIVEWSYRVVIFYSVDADHRLIVLF